jgi:hypothetical protein
MRTGSRIIYVFKYFYLFMAHLTPLLIARTLEIQ